MKQYASADANGDFVCVETCSGRRGRTACDSQGKQFLLRPDVSDKDLGTAVLQALAQSRVISPEEIAGFFDYQVLEALYEEWVARLLRTHGYKTRRALFKAMKHCNIESNGEQLILEPTRHEKLEGWGREKGDGIENA